MTMDTNTIKKIENSEMLRETLFSMADPAYKEFHARLIPTVPKDTVIGIRTPLLRKFAISFGASPYAKTFLRELPHTYYEENNLHGFLLERKRDFEETVAALDHFLPHVDNWATCDLIKPRVFKKNHPALLPKFRQWMHDTQTYTIRFGIGMMMTHFLDEDFQPEYLGEIAAIHSQEYYVNMMIAWYFATALAKQYEATLPYLETRHMEPWVHNKTIQKAIESRRITPEQKKYLRTLRLKKGASL